jgi:hypothetical protein
VKIQGFELQTQINMRLPEKANHNNTITKPERMMRRAAFFLAMDTIETHTAKLSLPAFLGALFLESLSHIR